MNGHLARQDMGDDLPRAGLSGRAGDRDDLGRQAQPVPTGQIAHRGDRVGHLQDDPAVRLDRTAADGAGSTGGQGTGDVLVAVEIFAGDGDEALAVGDRARIGVDARNLYG